MSALDPVEEEAVFSPAEFSLYEELQEKRKKAAQTIQAFKKVIFIMFIYFLKIAAKLAKNKQPSFEVYLNPDINELNRVISELISDIPFY